MRPGPHPEHTDLKRAQKDVEYWKEQDRRHRSEVDRLRGELTIEREDRERFRAISLELAIQLSDSEKAALALREALTALLIVVDGEETRGAAQVADAHNAAREALATTPADLAARYVTRERIAAAAESLELNAIGHEAVAIFIAAIDEVKAVTQ